MKFKKYILTTILSLLVSLNIFSAEITLSVDPFLLFPGYTDGTVKFNNLAGGGFVNAGINFFDCLNAGVQGGYFMLQKANAELLDPASPKYLSAIPLGVQLGAFYYPLARLEIGASASGGACIMTLGQDKLNTPYYNFQAQLGFRVNPSLIIGANASYLMVQDNSYFGNPGIAGLTAGIEAKFVINTSKNKEKISTKVLTADSIYPLMHKVYKENPFGTITIRNTESATITNVKVSFLCEGFTASQIECGSAKKIKRFRKQEFDLLADFNENMKQFTEEGKLPGQVVVEYELLGQKRVSVTPVSVPVRNRNQMSWVDKSSLACFVTSGSQEVLELSKYLVGIGRNKLFTGLNRNLQFAVYMAEGLRLYGIEYVPDSETPYNEYHLADEDLDSIQYPFQTMAYKSGDADEIGILLMSLLESVGISTAYIPCAEDFIVAVDLELDSSKVTNMFSSEDRVLVIEDSAYLPLSMKNLSKGFYESWNAGLVTINKAIKSEEDVEFFSVEEAWNSYPSAGFSENIGTIMKPSQVALETDCDKAIKKYMDVEFTPLIKDMQNRIANEGATPALLNKLGMYYVRSGQYKKAVETFEKSAAKNNVSAMVNLGNINSTQGNLKQATSWYKRALAIQPDNNSAIVGMKKINSEMEQ